MQQIFASNTMISNSLRASATMFKEKEQLPNDDRQRMATINTQFSDEKSNSDGTRQSVRNQDF